MVVEEWRLCPHDLIGYLKSAQSISGEKHKRDLRIQLVEQGISVYEY